MNAHNNVSRRTLLTGGLATGFLLAFHLPLRAAVNEPEQPKDTTDGKFAPNAFIRIDETGQTTLIMPQVEMGQGIYTSISMILAEELDADWAKVAAVARAAQRQVLRQSRLRTAGDRWLDVDPRLVEAAARSRRQRARHAGAGRGRAMAGRARELHDVEGRGHPRGKRPHARLWRARAGRTAARRRRRTSRSRTPRISSHIGQPLKRLDTPDKVNGKAVYGIDAILPDMKFAAIAQLPGVRRQGRQGR